MPQAVLLWLVSCNMPADLVRETTQSTFIDAIWKVTTTQTRCYQPTADNTDIHYLVILSIYAHYLYSIANDRPEVCAVALSGVTDAGDTCTGAEWSRATWYNSSIWRRTTKMKNLQTQTKPDIINSSISQIIRCLRGSNYHNCKDGGGITLTRQYRYRCSTITEITFQVYKCLQLLESSTTIFG